jgi:hypothetical protein
MAAFNGNPFSDYMQTNQEFMKNMAAFNQELTRFASERIQSGTQVLQDLSECKSWEKAVSVQSDFAQSATNAFMAEMPKFTEQVTRTCSAMWTPMANAEKASPESGA